MRGRAWLGIVLILVGCKSTKLATIQEDNIHDKVELQEIVTSFGKDLSVNKDIVLDFIYIAPDSSVFKGTLMDKSIVAVRDTTKRKESIVATENKSEHKEVVRQEERNTKTKVEQWTSLIWVLVVLIGLIAVIRLYRKWVA